MSTTVDHDTDPAAGTGGAEGTPLQYATVEDWVRDYLLPSFPRPAGELGAAGNAPMLLDHGRRQNSCSSVEPPVWDMAAGVRGAPAAC